MGVKDYTEATKYENLVRIAFNCQRGVRNGADQCFMQNAITMERGETYAKHLGSFQKQFEKVKLYLSKALVKLTNKRPFIVEKSFFLHLESKVYSSTTTDELMDIVDLALKKIYSIKGV
ncbi:hypothetical protein M2T28_03790 [Elizabethkingia miricola]|uniref:hypothetical protein n=1 Tax=Elizabethkingia miricola TaxID=172045 RepID=UPI002019AB0D|nr:hypothetical protein [Elizabethkingia miricola]MDV3460253.1 hypothetical protein [Elizabethkingia anophelis]MCL1651717.1 hypothetical protein [Elizabethkingia miricola]MDV3777112.1 hypothetical protein [Elizabethkingia anophelis]MDV3788673.1 hypothetical protein [Elizabethkingia anophelis]MDV3841545.1 hypothetical protein [Elizabethkingia anophelis]